MSLYAVVSESKVDGRYRLLMPRPLANAAKHFKRRQTNRALFVCHFVSPIRLSTHSFKAATTGFGSALHNAGLSSTAAIEKRLAASRLRKFQFHTFATI
jgi:hypothetical protein